jgi:hypothetical protein
VVVHANEVNCQIFRHAALKTTGEQVNPHASKEELERLVEQNLVYGCGRPFRMIKERGAWSYAEECGYI